MNFHLHVLFVMVAALTAACSWFSSNPVGFPDDASEVIDMIDEEAQDTFVEQTDVLDEDMRVDEASEGDEQDGWDLETADSAADIEDAFVEDVPGACESNEDCDDGDPCSGTEVCSSGGRCEPGRPLDDGTDCATASLDSGFCLDAVCVPHDCGDGIRTGDEECDDGDDNSDSTPDACRTTCLNACCGDRVIDTDEECDDASGFCSAECQMHAPEDWLECEDGEGNPVMLKVDMPARSSRWTEYRDFCRSLVDEEKPVNFSFYGLAVLADRNVWECLEPHLVTTEMFYIGLYQDDTDPEYSEPEGGWYWRGFNGSEWINVAPYNRPDHFLPGFIDNTGGSDTAEIVRIRYGFYTAGWEVHDWSIDASMGWGGICMIQF